MAKSEQGSGDWSVMSTKAAHRDGRSLSLHAGPSVGGPHGTGRGAHTWRLNTEMPIGQLKVNGSHVMTGACCVPRQFIGIDDFGECRFLNREPMWMPSRLPACQEHPGFGVCRSSRLGLLGLH